MHNLIPCIHQIVNKIPSDSYFDSHFVIEELIRTPGYHIKYIKACSDKQEIYQFHGQIAIAIKNIPGIIDLGEISYSHSIYGKPDKCHLFKK